MIERKAWMAALAAGLLAAPVSAQVLALRGATVHTVTGPPIENATILVRNGKIEAVGQNVRVAADARVVDLAGKTIIPGLMDNHPHIGFDIRGVNERGTRFAPR